MSPTLREFVTTGAAAAAFPLALGGCVAPDAGPSSGSGGEPDLILVNGNVDTIDDAQPKAEAFAVKNERITAVGSTDDVLNLASANTEVIDAGGMTVTPGFIDAHTHPSESAS